MRRPWAIALLVLGAAGCGGGSSGTIASPAGGSAGAGSSARASAQETVPARPSATFPAKSGADVIRLATLRPKGSASYTVTLGGADAKEYTLDVASDDRDALLHQKLDSGELWIGLDVRAGAVRFVCTTASGGAASCRKGDPDGGGLKAAGEIERILGNAFVRSTFEPVAGLSDAGFGQDTQIGLEVSCLAASLPTGDVRLCATKDGFITELTAGTTKMLATSVSRDVSAAELEAPATPK